MTATMEAPLVPRQPDDDARQRTRAARTAALAAAADARFERRRTQLDQVPDLDPRERRLLLDRELWGTRRIAHELGVLAGRVSVLRVPTGRDAPRVRFHPHPALLPERDAESYDRPGHPEPLVEAGRIREWAVGRGHHRLDTATGHLVPVPYHPGRPRTTGPRRLVVFHFERPSAAAEEAAVPWQRIVTDPDALRTLITWRDLDDLPRLREDRYRRRFTHYARSGADPRTVGWLLDRELWDVRAIAVQLGVSELAIRLADGEYPDSSRPVHDRPHPSMLPDPDAILGAYFSKPRGGEWREIRAVEAGRIREWAVHTGRYVIDQETGVLLRRTVEDPDTPAELSPPRQRQRTHTGRTTVRR